MGLLNRLASTLNAKANRILDRYDDLPADIESAYRRLCDELERIRHAESRLGDALQALHRDAEALEKCVAELEDEARSAAASGDTRAAREALARRLVLTNGMASLHAEQMELDNEDDRFAEAVTALENKLCVGRAHLDVVKARFAASGDRSEIDETLQTLENERVAVASAIHRAKEREAQIRAQSARIEALVSAGGIQDLSKSFSPIEDDVALARKSIDIARELHETTR